MKNNLTLQFNNDYVMLFLESSQMVHVMSASDQTVSHVGWKNVGIFDIKLSTDDAFLE
jgi:hypothetical protein